MTTLLASFAAMAYIIYQYQTSSVVIPLTEETHEGIFLEAAPSKALKTLLLAFQTRLRNGESTPGPALDEVLKNHKQNPAQLTTKQLLEYLAKTKAPQLYAETDGVGRWTPEEFAILDQLVLTTKRCKIYGDGGWGASIKFITNQNRHLYEKDASFVLISGALLSGDSFESDKYRNARFTANAATRFNIRSIDAFKENAESIIKANLEPKFRAALCQVNAIAKKEGYSAFVTVPGVGAGCFAGAFQNIIPKILVETICGVLNNIDHTNIKHVCLDLFERRLIDLAKTANTNFSHDKFSLIGTGDFNVQFFTKSEHIKASQETSNINKSESSFYSWFETVKRVKVVAADLASWPGNDINVGSNSTDEGATAGSAIYLTLGPLKDARKAKFPNQPNDNTAFDMFTNHLVSLNNPGSSSKIESVAVKSRLELQVNVPDWFNNTM